MYESLILPWSPSNTATQAETQYRSAGLLRTKGTIFLLPPPLSTLKSAYNSPPRPKTRMSAGAVALCKHFERGGASSEHGRMHPYWVLPRGSNEEKTRISGEVLDRMLDEVEWRNVMLLHPGVAVYEVRNARGWGMRWTLAVEEVEQRAEIMKVNGSQEDCASADPNARGWLITNTTFRGFIEPIEGMDHELDAH